MFLTTQVYKSFKEGQKRILVATDLVGRGIDIERVNIVINYDMPETDDKKGNGADTYLHRVSAPPYAHAHACPLIRVTATIAACTYSRGLVLPRRPCLVVMNAKGVRRKRRSCCMRASSTWRLIEHK